MIIKNKPQRPKKAVVIETMDCESVSLDTVVAWVNSFEGIEFKNVILGVEWSGYDCADSQASFRRKESDAEFQVKLDAYKKRLNTYNLWYATNKDEIEAELARREEVHVQRAARNIERERARLEKALAKLDKK